MDIENLRLYCLRMPGTTEGFPFGDQTLVFKVGGKIFALLPLDEPVSINLKCEPGYAVELRDQYPGAIRPGYHMNKKHWNTVSLIDRLDPRLIAQLVDHSYDLVLASLSKAERQRLQEELDG